MFFMFNADKKCQITMHGEYTLQAIGRLCTLTSNTELAKMGVTPPREDVSQGLLQHHQDVCLRREPVGGCA